MFEFNEKEMLDKLLNDKEVSPVIEIIGSKLVDGMLEIDEIMRKEGDLRIRIEDDVVEFCNSLVEKYGEEFAERMNIVKEIKEGIGEKNNIYKDIGESTQMGKFNHFRIVKDTSKFVKFYMHDVLVKNTMQKLLRGKLKMKIHKLDLELVEMLKAKISEGLKDSGINFSNIDAFEVELEKDEIDNPCDCTLCTVLKQIKTNAIVKANEIGRKMARENDKEYTKKIEAFTKYINGGVHKDIDKQLYQIEEDLELAIKGLMITRMCQTMFEDGYCVKNGVVMKEDN